MPATDGPSGLRPDAKPTARDVTGTDGSEIDKLAGSAVTDIEEYWAGAFTEAFAGDFEPVSELISWTAEGYEGQF